MSTEYNFTDEELDNGLLPSRYQGDFKATVAFSKGKRAYQESKSEPTNVKLNDVPEVSSEYDDLVPEIHTGTPIDERQAALNTVNVLEYYERVTGHKISAGKRSGTGYYNGNCKLPTHGGEDKHPSLGINPDKKDNKWIGHFNCNVCGGGSIADLVIKLNGGTGDFKWAERKLLIEECGWIDTGSGLPVNPNSLERTVEVVEQPVVKELPKEEPASPSTTTNVLSLVEYKQADKPDNLTTYEDMGGIDEILSKLVPGKFLYEYVKASSVLGNPPEYDLFYGLMLIAAAAGPRTRGYGHRGNFNLSFWPLFIAPPGAGKSRASHMMREMLKADKLVWKEIPPSVKNGYGISSGVRRMAAGSGEKVYPMLGAGGDPTSGEYPMRDITCISEYGEYSKLAAKSNIRGSSLIPAIQEYDTIGAGLDDVMNPTATKTGTVFTPENPFWLITASLQPNLISKQMGSDNVDNGIASRFYACIANENPRYEDIRNDAHVPESKLNELRAMLNSIAVYYQHTAPVEWELEDDMPVVVTVDITNDPDGVKKWNQQFNRYKHQLSDARARFKLFVLRLGTLFALEQHKSYVEIEDMLRADWVMEHVERSTELLELKSGENQYSQLEELILKAIAYYCESRPENYARVGEIRNYCKMRDRGFTEKPFLATLESLEQGEVVSKVAYGKEEKVKRKTVRYRIVDETVKEKYS